MPRQNHSIGQLSEELKRLRVSMAAFSEVWRLGQGQIGVGGYTFFWSGTVRTHTHGVAIAVADWLLLAVDNIRRISDRLR